MLILSHLCLGFACSILSSLGSDYWHGSAQNRVKLLTDALRHVPTPFAWVLAGTKWLPNHLVTSLTAIFHEWPYLVCSERCSRVRCSDQCTPVHPIIARHRQYTVFCQDRLRTPDLCNRKFYSLTEVTCCNCTIARGSRTLHLDVLGTEVCEMICIQYHKLYSPSQSISISVKSTVSVREFLSYIPR
jgi:hypothetical protein